MPKSYRTQVFVSYCRADEKWRKLLEVSLKQHIRNDRIDYWDDQCIDTGDNWLTEIKEAIKHAKVAVLLVTKSFLESDFIMNTELPLIIDAKNEKDGLTIIWISVSGFNEEKLGSLSEIQSIMKISEPLEKLDSATLNNRLIEIRKQISKILNPDRVPKNLPFPTLAELFVGRESELKDLNNHFCNIDKGSLNQPVAIIGGPGIGKTRLALEYAVRHNDDFSASLFVSANSTAELNANISRLCAPDILDLPEYQLPSQNDQKDAVIRWLQNKRNWLLIIDNVDADESVSAVQSLLHPLNGGQIIITSRINEWIGCAFELVLDVIDQEDAVEFLLKSTRSKREVRENDTEQVELMAERLGCLPLMITHASAYIRRYRESFESYLDSFEKKLLEILEWHDHNAIKYETDPTKDEFVKTIATTFFMAYDRLSSVHKTILRAAGLLAPDPIPVGMFQQFPEEFKKMIDCWCDENGEAASSLPIQDVIADLAHVSLITQSNGTFLIHRIEQRILESRVLQPWRDKWAQIIVRLVQAYAPSNSDDPSSWSVWYNLSPHVEYLWDRYGTEPGVIIEVSLLTNFARYFHSKGLYSKGILYAREVMEFYESNSSNSNPTLLGSIHLLGYLYEGNGNYGKAEPLYRRELAGWESHQGQLGDQTLRCVNRLASLLGLKGEFEEAKTLFLRAIDGREKTLGFNDPETLKSKQDFGSFYINMSDYKSAEPLLREALPGLEQSLGANHRDTLACAHNLALVLENNGELDEAEKLWKRAVDVYVNEFGASYPSSILVANCLKSLLSKRGKITESLNLQFELIKQRERDPDSKNDENLSIDQNNLGLEFRKIGKLDTAELLLKKALDRDQVNRGQTHPKIPHRLNNLCTVLIMLGKLDEAKKLLTKAWNLKSNQHDITSARILFVRILAELQPTKLYIGQLKTLLALDPLPDFANVVKIWDISYFIEYLRPKLQPSFAEFLFALANEINQSDNTGQLTRFPEWSEQLPVSLELKWS